MRVARVPYLRQGLTIQLIETTNSLSSHFGVYTDGDVAGFTASDVAGPGGSRARLADWLGSFKEIAIRNDLPMGEAILYSVFAAAINISKDNIGKTSITNIFTDGTKFTFRTRAEVSMQLLSAMTWVLLLHLIPIIFVLKKKISLASKSIGVLLVVFFSWVGYLIFYFYRRADQDVH